MNVTYHGAFYQYVPEKDESKPRTMIPGALHAKNEAGVDFYDLRDQTAETSLIVILKPAETTIFAASKGPLMAFPTEGMRLYEIVDPIEGLKPEKVLGLTFNTQTGELSPA